MRNGEKVQRTEGTSEKQTLPAHWAYSQELRLHTSMSSMPCRQPLREVCHRKAASQFLHLRKIHAAKYRRFGKCKEDKKAATMRTPWKLCRKDLPPPLHPKRLHWILSLTRKFSSGLEPCRPGRRVSDVSCNFCPNPTSLDPILQTEQQAAPATNRSLDWTGPDRLLYYWTYVPVVGSLPPVIKHTDSTPSTSPNQSILERIANFLENLSIETCEDLNRFLLSASSLQTGKASLRVLCANLCSTATGGFYHTPSDCKHANESSGGLLLTRPILE